MSKFDQTLVREVMAKIRDVPDFPKKGIIFKDLTPVLAHGPTISAVMQAFADHYRPMRVDLFAAIEARGFVLGAPIAASLGVGLALLRKPGKLPWNKVRQSYDL